jgi:hypothetical protein
MKGSGWIWLVMAASVMVACSVPPIYYYPVYEDPTAFVRLEFSPWIDEKDQTTWYSHPINLTRRHMQEALQGLRVRDRRPGPIRWLLGEPQLIPAFREEEIELLIPQLLEGLDLAVPQEVVAFYLSHPLNATRREVTSGGMFIKDRHLHIILSNHRTVYGIPPAGLIYDRRYPLLSLAPLSVDVLFASPEAIVPKKPGSLLEALLGDRRGGEIILDLGRLALVKV